MTIEAGRNYFENYRVTVKKPDPNRVPSYIRKDTVPVSKNGSQVVIGGQTRIDINI